LCCHLGNYEGIEVGGGVVGVDGFGAFELGDDEVGEGRGQGLVDDFGEVGGEDHDAHGAGGGVSGEGDGDDDGGVDGLAGDGGADGAGPEPAATGEDFHFGEGKGVGEFAGPVRDEGRDGEAGDEAEDGGEGLLVGPSGGGGEGDGDGAHDGEQGHGEEADPDGAAGGGITVDLSEDVAADVGDGKEQLRAADFEWADLADLLADEIGDEENDDESDGEEIEIAEAPHGERRA
jgi:hypothetical protein